MDNQPPAENIKVTLAQKFANLFVTKRTKTFLFLGTLLVGMGIAYIVSYPANVESADTFAYGAELPALILFFPFGLVYIIVNLWPAIVNVVDGYLVMIVFPPAIWILYIAIIGVGIASKNSKVSKVLFWIFAFLLLLNARGCASPM